MNPNPNPSSDDKKKAASESVTYYMDQLAIALAQEIPPERMLLYVAALSDLSEERLHYGFTQALKTFRPQFGVNFPSPADIRIWALSWSPPTLEAKDLEEKYAKTIEESTEEERREYSERLKEEMQKALAAGAFQMKSTREIAEVYAAERNGKSQIPADPVERAAWARKKEKEHGWRD